MLIAVAIRVIFAEPNISHVIAATAAMTTIIAARFTALACQTSSPNS
jgi:hypothetical protein